MFFNAIDIFKKQTLCSLLSFMAASSLHALPVYVSDAAYNREMSFNPTNSSNISERNDQFLWLKDTTQNTLEEHHFFHLKQMIAAGETAYQSYIFANTVPYGKMLIMDGELQSAQFDEFIYHESLIHPAMIAHPNPESVLIVGAGEGASAREVLRHPSVKRVVLIDIDGEVIQKCKEFLPEWHEGSFDHPKSQLLIMDGKKFIEEKKETFDVIYVDVCDKLDGSPASALYTEEFYRSVKECLNPGGIVAIQAMELDTREKKDHFVVHKNIQSVFKNVSSYSSYVPSFWATWGFVVATDEPIFSTLSQEKIDEILKSRSLQDLKHYDGETHFHMFSLPKALRSSMKKAKGLSG